MFLRRPEDLIVGDGPFAIDTEFHAESRYWPALHLIQVRAPGGPVQLLDPHDPDRLRALAEPLLSRPWIVHAGRLDLPLLQRALGAVPAVVFDTQIAAGLVDVHYPARLGDLLQRWCAVDLAKAETLSDWSRRPLSAEQVRYASTDVLHLHALWDALARRAAAMGRHTLLEAACTEARKAALQAGPHPASWRTVPGVRSLDADGARALRALFRWRDAIARDQDRPPHAVLHNGALIDLARRRPRSIRELLHDRRAPKKALRTHGEAIITALRRAEAGPYPTPLPARPGSPAWARLSWWNAWAEIEGLQARWAARLILPPSLREQLAAGEATVAPWREALLGEPFQRARRGEHRLARP